MQKNFSPVNKIIISLAVILGLEIAVNGYLFLGGRYHFQLFGSGKSGVAAETEKKPEQPAESSQPAVQGAAVLETAGLLPRQIDGVMVEKEKSDPHPVAAMIDNMIDARPSSGLSKANLVYEAIAESGITRFLAVFASNYKIEKIGPVRSARPYFLDWADELGTLYAHCGGSPQALGGLASGQYDVLNLDQFYSSRYFWRDNSRLAPHNLYTSSDLLSEALAEKKAPAKGEFESWLFKEDAEIGQRPASGGEKNPAIDFSTYSYKASWHYDRENNDYRRYQADKPHEDADGSQIRAKNVIVQYVKISTIDSYGRLKTVTAGTGEAIVFQDGKSIAGTWRKDEKGRRTRFFDGEGNEIRLNRGTTWVEAVPAGRPVKY